MSSLPFEKDDTASPSPLNTVRVAPPVRFGSWHSARVHLIQESFIRSDAPANSTPSAGPPHPATGSSFR